MITIKDYAKQQGISHQAVYQMLATHGEELESHIVKQGRTRFLTEEAVAILEKYRNQAPIVMERQDQVARIKELEQEREQLLIKTADLASRLAELADWKAEKAVEIAAAEHQQQLLTTTQADLERKADEIRDLKKQVEDLQHEQERKLSWRERITGKRKGE